MCGRFDAVSFEELSSAARLLHEQGRGASGLAELLGLGGPDAVEAMRPTPDSPTAPHAPAGRPSPGQALPGSVVAALVVSDGHLAVERMTWGVEASWKPGKLIINARLDDALARPGGMWADPLASRRCAIPARGFYEPRRTRTARSARTGRQVRQQVRFAPAGGGVMFLAGVYQDGRCAVMTTSPNADVAPVHDRMPVVLAPTEVSGWLGGSYARMVDRSAVRLEARDADAPATPTRGDDSAGEGAEEGTAPGKGVGRR
ncbi:MAG: SOS response-associated peptidase family protein [Coriobacteriales bacterium]|jgi:putative SOS response-associated peptidase YedK